MNKAEINVTKYGELIDMMTCLNIESGAVEYIAPPQTMAFEQAMQLK